MESEYCIKVIIMVKRIFFSWRTRKQIQIFSDNTGIKQVFRPKYYRKKRNKNLNPEAFIPELAALEEDRLTTERNVVSTPPTTPTQPGLPSTTDSITATLSLPPTPAPSLVPGPLQ